MVPEVDQREPEPLHCPNCGTGIAPGLLRCPACRALVFADQLKKLAAAAEADAKEGRLAEATHAWHEALMLLPLDAAQRGPIDAKLAALGERMERGEGRSRPKESHATRNGVLAGVGAILLFLVTKGKFLLLGLTKAGALLSMFAFLGIYWREWGWTLAVGIVVSIYLHELGHVAALHRYGIPVSAPMFVPGLGAYVRHGALPTSRIGARVALAGPAAGLLTAGVALAIGAYTGAKYWAAIAHLGALINLLNLIPVWQLDGARVVAPLSLVERIGYALTLVAVAALTRDGGAVAAAVVTVGALFFLGKGKGGDLEAGLLAILVTAGLGGVLVLSR